MARALGARRRLTVAVADRVPVLRKYCVHLSRHLLFQPVFMVQTTKHRTRHDTPLLWHVRVFLPWHWQ